MKEIHFYFEAKTKFLMFSALPRGVHSVLTEKASLLHRSLLPNEKTHIQQRCPVALLISKANNCAIIFSFHLCASFSTRWKLNYK